MRNYAEETEKRIQFIRQAVAEAHADGIIFGNSGGKDSALVGILCKMACENTEGIILPCSSKRNFTIDKDDGMEVADQFGIKTRVIDLTAQKELAMQTLSQAATLSEAAIGNLAPRLRMMTLYAIGASENRLVAGTGNASEYYMGYFTKWGDGAYDLNPIADLTATEVFEFLRYLKAPEAVITKAPSAGLFEGQTDEEDMGVTYAAIDRYITTGQANDHDEDEPAMAEAVEDILTYHHYLVDRVADGEEALAYARTGDYDGLILDIMMPRMDGLEVLAQLRREGNRIPVLLLTAKGEVEDRITGLDLGADDYLPKPFAMGELLARVRAMLRRREAFTPEVLRCGDVTLNQATFQLSCGGVSVTLPKLEYRLMEVLMGNQGIYLSSEDLLVKVWGYDAEAELGVVWVYLSYLRKRLAKLGAHVAIRVRRGVGYTLEVIP